MKEVIGTAFNSLQAVFAIAEAGDQNKGNQPGGGIFFELTAEFIAGLAGHDYVREDQVRRQAADLCLRLRGT